MNKEKLELLAKHLEGLEPDDFAMSDFEKCISGHAGAVHRRDSSQDFRFSIFAEEFGMEDGDARNLCHPLSLKSVEASAFLKDGRYYSYALSPFLFTRDNAVKAIRLAISGEPLPWDVVMKETGIAACEFADDNDDGPLI